jgi:lipoate-protein ligase A
MPALVKDLSVEELRTLVRDTVEQTLEDSLEELQALSSESFLHSIEEARKDYREGRVTTLSDLLDG